jgi:uncharacterized protein YjiS (DUF1127 family)
MMYSAGRQAARPREGAGWSIVVTILEGLELWAERRRQRRALLELSDHLLKDLGLTRLDALREGGKPFWRR